MSRPTDWAPLASTDPVPGDPDRVALVAARNASLADLLEEQTAALRAVGTAEGWDADAGRVFARSAQDLAGRLDTARRRYSVVAEALGGYVPRLRQAQLDADAARLAARDAQARLDANAPGPAPTAPTPEQVAAQQQRQTARTEAEADLERARRRLAEAVRERDAAARAAGQRIQDVVDHDGLTDSFWDKAKDWTSDRWDAALAWVHDNAGWIRSVADICGTIATVLTVVAVAISFIPVLDFLSPVLLGVAVGLTAVALVCHLALALSGDGSWLDVGLDVFALVTFGYGRTAATGLRAARLTLRSTARSALAAAERRAAAPQVRTLSRQLGSRATRTAARRAARTGLESLQRQAVSRAAATTTRLERTELPLLRRLVYGDGELARVAGGTGALVRAVEGNALVAARDGAAVRAAADQVMHHVRTLAGAGVAATAVDLADRPTSLTLPDGTVLDLDGPLPDKPSLFDPLKPHLTWGRYASHG